MSAPDLKPCPFCGGDAQAVWQTEDTTAAYVDCMGCDARVLGVANRRDNIKATDAAIATWNTRAPLAEAQIEAALKEGMRIATFVPIEQVQAAFDAALRAIGGDA